VVTEGAVAEVLNGVMDPHMNVSLPDMGMVRRITVSEDGDVDVGLVFPCVGCPAWDLIQNDIKRSVGALAGVRSTKGLSGNTNGAGTTSFPRLDLLHVNMVIASRS